MKRDFHKHYVEGHTLIKKKLGKKFIEYADIMCGSDDLEDKKVTKFIKKYNAAPRECWAFDSNLAMYLYEHIKMFEDTTIADIDNTDEFFMYSIPTWESYINGGKDDERTYEFIDVTLHQALDIIADSCLNYLHDTTDENEMTLEYFQYGLHVLAEVVYAIWW